MASSAFRDRTGKIIPSKLEEDAKKVFVNDPNRHYVASGVLNSYDILAVEEHFKNHPHFNVQTAMLRRIGNIGFFTIGDYVEYEIRISVKDPANYFNT